MTKNTSRIIQVFVTITLLFFFTDVALANTSKKKKKAPVKTTTAVKTKRDSISKKPIPFDLADTETTQKSSDIDGLIWFAKQQLGTPYKYASADPKNGGLDCSGFLYYVFTHFNIKVPRTSKDYMSFGKTITQKDAKKGDVIVFTGTDATKRVGGHVGLVLENNNGDLTFIHGSSGKAKGVTISKLSEGYYTQRFLKVVRVVN